MGYLWHLELVNLMVARDLGTRNVTLYFFLNTNNSNNTNVFWHTDLTDLTDSLLLMFEHEIFFEHEFYE